MATAMPKAWQVGVQAEGMTRGAVVMEVAVYLEAVAAMGAGTGVATAVVVETLEAGGVVTGEVEVRARLMVVEAKEEVQAGAGQRQAT